MHRQVDQEYFRGLGLLVCPVLENWSYLRRSGTYFHGCRIVGRTGEEADEISHRMPAHLRREAIH